MLFNSQEFLFVFLPATLLGFYLLGRVSRQAAILWLILASLVFYGWWRPLNILIIGPSIIVNYLLALPPFPLFFEKKLLREAVAGRLPESIRTRRKSPLAGDPLAAHLRQRGIEWPDKRTWSEEMESYVDTSVFAARRRERPSANVEAKIRPICLNFWLQSARRVRYNLRAEVRNG